MKKKILCVLPLLLTAIFLSCSTGLYNKKQDIVVFTDFDSAKIAVNDTIYKIPAIINVKTDKTPLELKLILSDSIYKYFSLYDKTHYISFWELLLHDPGNTYLNFYKEIINVFPPRILIKKSDTSMTSDFYKIMDFLEFNKNRLNILLTYTFASGLIYNFNAYDKEYRSFGGGGLGVGLEYYYSKKNSVILDVMYHLDNFWLLSFIPKRNFLLNAAPTLAVLLLHTNNIRHIDLRYGISYNNIGFFGKSGAGEILLNNKNSIGAYLGIFSHTYSIINSGIMFIPTFLHFNSEGAFFKFNYFVGIQYQLNINLYKF